MGFMSDRGRLAGIVMGWVGGDSAMEFADFLIEEGYGVVHVVQATALEEAAAAIDKLETMDVSKPGLVDWLCDRASNIYEEGAKKK